MIRGRRSNEDVVFRTGYSIWLWFSWKANCSGNGAREGRHGGISLLGNTFISFKVNMEKY